MSTSEPDQLATEERSAFAQINTRIESLEQRLVSIIGFAGFTLPLLGGFSAEQITTAHSAVPEKGQTTADVLDLEEAGLPFVGDVELVTLAFCSALVSLAIAIYIGVRLLRQDSAVLGLGSQGLEDLRELRKHGEDDFEEAVRDVYCKLPEALIGRAHRPPPGAGSVYAPYATVVRRQGRATRRR
jgi:hypothetical protein